VRILVATRWHSEGREPAPTSANRLVHFDIPLVVDDPCSKRNGRIRTATASSQTTADSIYMLHPVAQLRDEVMAEKNPAGA